MSQNNNQSFMDKNTIIAVLFVGFFWIGWQSYLNKKYPDAYKDKVEKTQNEESKKANISSAEQTQVVDAGSVKEASSLENKTLEVKKEEKLIFYEDEYWKFFISTKGMGFKDVQLKKYTERNGENVKLGSDTYPLPYSTNVIGRRSQVDFDIVKIDEGKFQGTAVVQGVKLIKTITINSENYTVRTNVKTSGINDSFSGLVTYMSEGLKEFDPPPFFMPQYEHQEFFVKHDDTDDRVIIKNEEASAESFSRAKIFSIGSQYFTIALLDKSQVMPDIKTTIDVSQKLAKAVISYQLLNNSDTFEINYLSYVGPKALETLKKVDEELIEIINLGWFSWLAQFILKLLKFFYSVVGNWGVAIVILTVIVRLLVLPLYIMSMKSMKKMQAVQPQIKAAREKYKEDPQKMNQEVMMIMKEAGANPVGGCLPMFLQFPVFIALYQVLGQSIELYKAPFALWITDLSLKDPYYIFPVMMGITIFLQQKLTPQTLEPAQQKVMMLMPILFSFFMLSLPSGLTLYIFVSSLVAVIQQLFFMKDRKQQA